MPEVQIYLEGKLVMFLVVICELLILVRTNISSFIEVLSYVLIEMRKTIQHFTENESHGRYIIQSQQGLPRLLCNGVKATCYDSKY